MVQADRSIEKLSVQAQKACTLFLHECKKLGIDIFITETLRTQERQNYLYCKGRTSTECISAGISSAFAFKYASPNDDIVTYTLKSNHSNGLAWDIACNGGSLYNRDILKKAGDVAVSLGIEWGGNWTSFVDMPHFQISNDWTEPVKSIITQVDILLNGVNKTVDAVNIDGYNYIKLQDLRDNKISIGYDGIPIVTCK